jgi:zinc transport system substrate-binding protein
LLLCIVSDCKQKRENQGKPVVTVSILPLKYFADRISGGVCEVNVLVPPGSGPETYEPSPQEMILVSQSIIFFKTGHYDIETLLSSKISDVNKDIAIIDLSHGMNIIKEDHAQEEAHAAHSGGIDPHIWSGVSTSKVMASNMLIAFEKQFPSHTGEFKKNYALLLNDLDSLDRYIKSKISTAKRNTIVMYHPSLGYYTRDYQLNQISLEAEGKTPSASAMKTLIDEIRLKGIKTIFMQSQFDIHNTEAIAKEINGKVVEIDPLAPDWLKNMYLMTDKIVISLNE